MEGIRRRFGSVTALRGANLTLAAGEVHAVLGENGAGKTTLLSVLAGLVAPDAGRLLIRGSAVRLRSPREAWAQGVGIVHQHFALVARLTVLENLALAAPGVLLRLPRVRARAEALMDRTGLRVPLDRDTETLGVGERQRVEVLKVLLRDPDILILDEPTAVLAPEEVAQLFDLLRALAAAGRTIVLVGHKLDEILSVADRVTVLRGGRTVLEAPRSEVDVTGLVRAMVGSTEPDRLSEIVPVEPEGERPGAASARLGIGPPTARLSGVSTDGSHGEVALRDVTLEVRRGEVVGVAGVEGNGQRELALILAGLRSPDIGQVDLPVEPAFIPQDRTREGLIGDFSITANVALALHRHPDYARGGFLSWRRIAQRTRELMKDFEVRAESSETRAGTLSGGNQQRLVVARELGGSPHLLVAENPTRGLDVTAAAFVHRRLRALPDAGVVLISTDLDEVMRLSDRIVVMVRGHLIPVDEADRTREGIGAVMLTGHRPEHEDRPGVTP